MKKRNNKILSLASQIVARSPSLLALHTVLPLAPDFLLSRKGGTLPIVASPPLIAGIIHHIVSGIGVSLP